MSVLLRGLNMHLPNCHTSWLMEYNKPLENPMVCTGSGCQAISCLMYTCSSTNNKENCTPDSSSL